MTDLERFEPCVTHLYRHFNQKGVLLYVGISLSTVARLTQHRTASHWYNDIASVTVEKFESRAAALRAERCAIAKENPVHNLKRPTTREVKQAEVLTESSRNDLLKRVVQFNPLYSIDEVCAALGFNPSTVKKLIEQNKLGAICVSEFQRGEKTFKRYRVTGWQLIEFLENAQDKGKI